MSEQQPSVNHQPDNSECVEEYTTVHSIFVRKRNCLMVKADFSPLFVGYYLHLMQHGLRNDAVEDGIFKDLLAFFTLHTVSRPWQEYHAWTFNVKDPVTANYFVTGSSLTEDVIGQVFTRDVRETEVNMLYAQNMERNKEMHTSVIPLATDNPIGWIEEFYRQSEQRQARAFDLGEDKYALITAEPGADFDWLSELTAEQVAKLDEIEELKLLETRRFAFRCGCTLERILPTIRAMQKDFADILSEQGYLDVSCPRCGVSYHITPDMLNDKKTAPDSCM